MNRQLAPPDLKTCLPRPIPIRPTAACGQSYNRQQCLFLTAAAFLPRTKQLLYDGTNRSAVYSPKNLENPQNLPKKKKKSQTKPPPTKQLTNQINKLKKNPQPSWWIKKRQKCTKISRQGSISPNGLQAQHRSEMISLLLPPGHESLFNTQQQWKTKGKKPTTFPKATSQLLTSG